jgi:hypothetical protein
MLSEAQAGARHARDAARERGRSQKHLAGTRFLRRVEHGFHRAGESDRSSWGGSARTTYLGHFPTGPTAAGLSGVVASVLSFCTPPCLAAGEARAATRARWQSSGATKPPAYSSHGSGENQPTMDGAGSAVPSLLAGAMRPHGSMKGVRRRPGKEQEAVWGKGKQGQER